MKMNFRITLRHGIYFPVALLLCCVMSTQANALQSESKAVESDKPAATKQESPETKESASEQTDEETESVKEQIEALTADYQIAMVDFRDKLKAIKTRAEFLKLRRSNPQYDYSAKLLKIYEANPEDEDAQTALVTALEMKGPRTVTKASKALLELAEEQKPEDARKSYLALAEYGNPTAQREAVDKLFEFAEEEKDDAVAIEMLMPITNSNSRAKAKQAVEAIWDRVKDDLEEAEFDTLAVIGMKAGPEASKEAFDAMLEYHGDSEDFVSVLATVPETPNEAFEAAVVKVAKDGEGDVQLQAAVSWAQYVKIRARYLDFERMPKAQKARLDKESQNLKELLGSFDGDSKLHKAAEAELFELENLSPGAEAMDIVGTDLNGSELKLSDYRGKVVFLDFWGDW